MDWTQGIVNRKPLKLGNRVHPRVVILEYTNGEKLILKVSKAEELAEIEAKALQVLSELGASVPKVIDYNPSGFLVMEYIDGIPWGSLPQRELDELLPSFLPEWEDFCQAWQKAEPILKNHATEVSVDDFKKQLHVLGRWLCPQANKPKQAEEAWLQIVEIALSQSQTFGPLDYNPQNLIKTKEGFLFCDFEAYGNDWHYRRLLQYTSKIRNADGEFCWHIPLRKQLATDPVLDAHYILFAATAWKRWLKEIVSPASLWQKTGANQQALGIWRDAWNKKRGGSKYEF